MRTKNTMPFLKLPQRELTNLFWLEYQRCRLAENPGMSLENAAAKTNYLRTLLKNPYYWHRELAIEQMPSVLADRFAIMFQYTNVLTYAVTAGQCITSIGEFYEQWDRNTKI